MKKTVFILLLTLLYIGTVAAAEEEKGIRFFKGSWKEALEEAGRTGKLIFMDCYSTWCGPCKGMEKNIFTLETVGTFFNTQFINVKMDMERGEGVELSKRYDIMGYPTYLFINPKGFVVLTDVGSKKEDAFLELGRKAVALKDSKSMDERFSDGERDPYFLKSYLASKVKFKLENSIERIIGQLFAEEGGELFADPFMWSVFRDYSYDIHSEAAHYVIANPKKLYKLYGKREVDGKIRFLFTNIRRLITSLYEDEVKSGRQTHKKILNEETYQAYKADIMARKIPNAQRIVRIIDFFTLSREGKLQEAYALSEKDIKEQPDAENLYYWAALAERLFRDKHYRELAAKWAEAAATLAPDSEFFLDANTLSEELKNSDTPLLKSSKRIKL